MYRLDLSSEINIVSGMCRSFISEHIWNLHLSLHEESIHYKFTYSQEALNFHWVMFLQIGVHFTNMQMNIGFLVGNKRANLGEFSTSSHFKKLWLLRNRRKMP